MGGSRCPGVCGLVGGQVLVRGMNTLVRALSSMLTHSRALEPHRGRRHGLSVSRGLLLGLKQTLVAPLTHWGFMRTLLGWDGVSVWAHLWSDAWVYLPCVGGDVWLVLGVCGGYRGLGRPLLMGHGMRWRLHGVVSGYIRGSS